MNKRTIALTDQQYIDIITAIKGGFKYVRKNYGITRNEINGN